MTSGIYTDNSQGYLSPFKVSHRSRFFRVLLKLTSAEWTQVQSTALETLMRPRIIYSTVSDSGEPAGFGF